MCTCASPPQQRPIITQGILQPALLSHSSRRVPSSKICDYVTVTSERFSLLSATCPLQRAPQLLHVRMKTVYYVNEHNTLRGKMLVCPGQCSGQFCYIILYRLGAVAAIPSTRHNHVESYFTAIQHLWQCGLSSATRTPGLADGVSCVPAGQSMPILAAFCEQEEVGCAFFRLHPAGHGGAAGVARVAGEICDVRRGGGGGGTDADTERYER